MIMATKVISGIKPYPYPKNALGRYQSCFSATLAVFCQQAGKVPLAYYLAQESGLGVFLGDRYFDVRPTGSLQMEAQRMAKVGLNLVRVPLQSPEAVISEIHRHLSVDQAVIVPVDAYHLPHSPLTYHTSHTEHDVVVYGYEADSNEFHILDSLFGYQGTVAVSFLRDALGSGCSEVDKPPFWLFTVHFTSPEQTLAEIADDALQSSARRVLGLEPTPAPTRSDGRWLSGALALDQLAEILPSLLPLPDDETAGKVMYRFVSVAEKRLWLSELVTSSTVQEAAKHQVVEGFKQCVQLWMVARLWLGKCQVQPTRANIERMVKVIQQAKAMETETAAAVLTGYGRDR